MRKKNVIKIFTILFVGLLLTGVFVLLTSQYHVFKGYTLFAEEQGVSTYYCPMHPSFTSDKPGNCGICGMKLVKKEEVSPKEHTASTMKSGRKILYYRNPMDPEITSPVPMKDSMGMDYVPVYEEGKGQEGTIHINPERQQLIGVKKEEVQKRKLTYQILTVGRVAYDPQLYVAQEEYLQALKTKEALGDSSIAKQTNSLLEAAQRKLLLLGMSKEEIVELAKQKEPQRNLYLPTEENSVWVYITIYEYESSLVKTGVLVEIESIAFPGEIFTGKITSITPVFDPMTRSMRARAEIDNPENKLKPEMYVNVKINVDLGEKLAVPETAVLDTGLRKIVYLAQEDDTLQQREVKLGPKAQGYYEVVDGLKEGDIVITSGNFLVDSESKLQGSFHGPTNQGKE